MTELKSFLSDGFKQHYDFRTGGVNYYGYSECGIRKELSASTKVLTQAGQQNFALSKLSPATIHGIQEILERITFQLSGRGRAHCSVSFANESVEVDSQHASIGDSREYSACQVAITSSLLSVQRTYPLHDGLLVEIEKFLTSWETTLRAIEGKSKQQYDNKKSTVVFSEGSGGFFVHEVFGHLVEGDSVARSASLLRRKYALGDVIGASDLTVVDDPEFNKTSTFLNRIDDEGVEMHKICMIKNGVLAGYLCDTSSSKNIENGEAFIGCARRQSFKYSSIPRMRSTRVLGCKNGGNLEIFLKAYRLVVIVENAIAGRVNPNTGAFALQCAGRLVQDGQQVGVLPSMVITGNVFEALPDVVAIGSDLSSYQVFCGKRGQHVPVSIESPTMVIEPLSVFGDFYANNN